MGISVAEASLLALFPETLLYGVFLTLYLSTLFILSTKTGVQRRLLVPVATLLLCIATAHVIIGFVRALQAFVFGIQGVGASACCVGPASPLGLAQTALYVTQTTLADGVMIWRCYVLKNKSLFVAIPGCTALLTNLATGCYVIWTLSRDPVASAVPFNANICLTTFYSLTMVISITCTILIAWRIYRAPSFTPHRAPTLLPVFIVIIETGAIYAASVLALLIAFLSKSNGKFAALEVITPIVGIAFCLVILQVHFQVGANHSTKPPVETRGFTTSLFVPRDVRDVDLMGRNTVLAVHVIKESENATEDGSV